MAIQNSINQMLGTLGTVSALEQHLDEQKKAQEIQQAKDWERAGEEYVESGKEAIKLMDEAKELEAEQKLAKKDPLMKQAKKIMKEHDPSKDTYSYNELIKDENGDVYTANQYLERGTKRLKDLQQKIEANEYAQNAVRFRMQAQDKRWAAQGIDLNTELYEKGKLNTEEEHKRIMEWKQGGKK